MKKRTNPLVWLWLLMNRMYKRPVFLVILILIPLLTFCYSTIAKDDSGMICVALYAQDEPLAQQVLTALQQDSQLMQYTRCATPEAAEDLVRTGKADAAWIFAPQLQQCIDTFTAVPEKSNAFVRVVQREETVALMLAREKLSGVLYTHLARSFYLDYMRENFPAMGDLSDDALLSYYDGVALGDSLFDYDSAQNAQQVHYLLSPVRGLLAVMMVLGSLAAAMYHIRDIRHGTFCWLSPEKRALPELAGQWVCAVNLGAVSLIALALAGLAGKLLPELAVLLLYSLCVAVFGMLLRRILGSIRVIGVMIPLLIVAMLLVCPVFFDLGALRMVQFLLPPTYYINGVYNTRYILYMAVYTLGCGGLYWLWGRLFHRH